jgi:hypothetical protein
MEVLMFRLYLTYIRVHHNYPCARYAIYYRIAALQTLRWPTSIDLERTQNAEHNNRNSMSNNCLVKNKECSFGRWPA